MLCALKKIPRCMSVSIEVLVTKEWKQPKCSSIWVYFTFLQYIMGVKSTFFLYYFICFPKISMRLILPFPLYWLLRVTHNGNGIDSFAIPPLNIGRASARKPVFWFLVWCDFYFSIQWSGQDQITGLGGTFGDASYRQWTAQLFIVS